MTKLPLYVIVDRSEKPHSYLTRYHGWDILCENTQFFSKETLIEDAFKNVLFPVKGMAIEQINITVD
jgi:hypothetical protein